MYNKEHTHHKYIKEKEKKRICFRHNKEFKYYCFDCQENFVKKKGRRNIKIMK